MNARALAVLVVLAGSAPARAYWAKNHLDLNRQVFDEGRPWREGFARGSMTVLKANQYLARFLYVARPDEALFHGVSFDANVSSVYGAGNTLGTDTPDDYPKSQNTLREWNIQGGLWEDGFANMKQATAWAGRRAVNHFHDPLNGSGGYTGYTPNISTGLAFIDVVRGGISVTEWVMNESSGGARNKWGYPTIGEQLHQAFTFQDQKLRESKLANALRAMGQVEHLVEDNTVPDHARDLAHPGDGWEEYLGTSRNYLFGATPQPWVEFPVTSIEKGGIRALWDRDVYSSSPQVTLSLTDPPGLDEFVSANFFAWNRLTKLGELEVPTVNFTTIPDAPNKGFTTPKLQNTPLLIQYVKTASFPWPRLGEYLANHYDSTSETLPLKPIATDTTQFGESTIDEKSWANYELPLMSRAHGYAQSVLSLALQPARAEIITEENGDVLRLSVRLWNLWPQGGPHSVTWHVDELTVVGLSPYSAEAPSTLDFRPLTVTGKFDVAPGTSNQPPTRQIPWPNRGALAFSSHTVVLVKAHLGDSKQTPLLFSVPIVNPFVVVQQTGGFDASPAYSNITGNCIANPPACRFTGENGIYRNPLEQRATGKIDLLPPEVDTFGRPADANLKKAYKEDARISEVMLFGFPRGQSQQNMVPVKAVKSELLLTGSKLTQVGPGHWVRPVAADDKAGEGPITFEAKLDLSDFYFADLGTPLADAARASGTVYIGVMTTAGALYLQRLILWPLRHPSSVTDLIDPVKCKVDNTPQAGNVNENRTICQESPVSSPCTPTYRLQRIQTMYGDNGAAQTQPPLQNFFTTLVALAFSDDVRPIEFGGIKVNLTGDKLLPTECNIQNLPQVWPAGNGTLSCWVLGPSGLAIFKGENTSSPGSCPTTANLSQDRTAVYKRYFFPDLRMVLKKVWGIEQPPSEAEFTLQ